MKKEREIDEAELAKVSGGGASLGKPCWGCLPCPDPGGDSMHPEREEHEDPEGTIHHMGEA